VIKLLCVDTEAVWTAQVSFPRMSQNANNLREKTEGILNVFYHVMTSDFFHAIISKRKKTVVQIRKQVCFGAYGTSDFKS
jgi:hypothetical protein